jgi:hypothetical protein
MVAPRALQYLPPIVAPALPIVVKSQAAQLLKRLKAARSDLDAWVTDQHPEHVQLLALNVLLDIRRAESALSTAIEVVPEAR